MRNAIKKVTEILLKEQGVDVSKYEELFLGKCIQKRVSETLCNSMDGYCALLKENSTECQLLLESLSVSYSEFFRNPLTFSVLEKIIIPALMLNKKALNQKEIRVWSAACAAGQEIYSMVMLLNEATVRGNDGIEFLFFATDENQAQVDIARLGQYPKIALNNINLSRLVKWFTKHGSVYRIKDELKEQVDFSNFDLLDDGFSSPPASIFGDFDIVFCANVLFYYSHEFRERILVKVNKSLSDNGFLVTSETEREILLQHGFEEVFPQSAIFRKKL
jgi:chemotaxis methyl-accepting protein methylase